MLVLKIVCLELCPISLTRSGCNCKQLLWAQSSHMGDLPLSHFSARQSFMYFLLYSLNKLHLKIVWAFASFTLWLSLMTSPDYLVVKCKIIFQKGSVPQNVQHHCLLQHPYRASTVYVLGMDFEFTLMSFEVHTINVTSTIALIFMCLMSHTEKKGKARSKKWP